MTKEEYAGYDALGLAELVRDGEVTAVELIDTAIELLESHNGVLNAVVFEDYQRAREQAAEQPAPESRGPLQGAPLLLKDASGDCVGMPTRLACRALVEVPPSDHDSVQVARFKAAGLIPLGKTNVPEWGLLGTTESQLYGPANNPWNLERSPGGSSGGSAAAVAARLVPVAHANDGGGSIRIPASACGLVGLKPSRGRVSLGPVLGEWIDGFTCEHVLTRTVRDCAALLDLTAGPAPGEPYGFEAPAGSYLAEISKAPGKLRIAYYTGSPSGRPLHEDCKEAVLAAARLCEELGHEVEEAAPAADLGAMLESWKVTYFASAQLMVDMAVELLTGEKPRPEDFEPLTLAMAERARGISAFDYQVAAVNRQMQARVIGEFHESYDLWLTPSMALPPVPTGTYCGNTTDLDAVWDEYHPYSPIQNATGQPSVSLPLYWNADGLPIGTMFTAALGNEALLFRIGAQLEQARPWIGRTPPVVAG